MNVEVHHTSTTKINSDKDNIPTSTSPAAMKVDGNAFDTLPEHPPNLDSISIGKRADPNSVRPVTRPIGRYTGRVSGWECRHPLRIGLSSVELTCTPSAARANGFAGRSDRSLLVANPIKRRSNL